MPRNVTAKLLGDPAPDRKMPVLPPDRTWGQPPPPSPIHLTFEEMRRGWGMA